MANPILLADTPTPDLHVLPKVEEPHTANCLHCWSTGLTKREIRMQCRGGWRDFGKMGCSMSATMVDWRKKL